MTQASFLLFPNEVQTFQRNLLMFEAKLKQHWLSFEPVKLHLTNQVSYYYESLTVKLFHQWYILNPCELKEKKKNCLKSLVPTNHPRVNGIWNQN